STSPTASRCWCTARSSPPATRPRSAPTRRCRKPTWGAPMLEIRDLHAWYGKSHVLHGVDLHVGTGEIVSLLGRNGVGRSTAVRAVMGHVQASGSVRFQGCELLGLPPY